MPVSRYKKRGWYKESHRHYLAAKGIKTKPKRYYYTPTFVVGDMSLIAADAMGTAGAAAVPWIFPALVAVGAYKGTEYIVKKKKRTGSYFAGNVVHAQPGHQMTANGVPIVADEVEDGRVYPVTPNDVAVKLNEVPKEHLKGLKEVHFSNPKGEQKEAWGQYVRSQRTVKIFSQPQQGAKIDGQPAPFAHKHTKEYVIPHELGHHRALTVHDITDKDIAMAEARADANVIGMDPTDRDVKLLKR